MRCAKVYNKDRLAGHLVELDDGTFRFQYEPEYLADESTGPVSLSLPKRSEPYRSDHLFAFFYGLLAEGPNRQRQCRRLKIDEDDPYAWHSTAPNSRKSRPTRWNTSRFRESRRNFRCGSNVGRSSQSKRVASTF